ncbi:MAG TPA: Ig-like domain-containing protein [Bacteroidia bacterium]
MIKIYRNLGKLLLIHLLLFSYATYAQKTVGLTKKLNGNDENGYVLFSPIGMDTAYLINKCGQKVHSWHTQYTPGLSMFIKPNGNLLKCGTYDDTTFGTAGGRGGIIEEYDWNSNLLWKYVLFNDSLCQHHDIHPLPNGNVLVLAWHSITKAEAMQLGRRGTNFNNINELWGERIIELKPIGTDSAEIVWQWDLFDHLIQDNDVAFPNYGMVSQHPELMDINYAVNLKTNDWIHANAIDYNAELDQIVISAHNICEFWIIDHSTTTAEAASHTGGDAGKGGDLLYRWGNPAAYKNGSTVNQKLFRQHNARWIPNGYRDSGQIMLFNNGWGRDTFYSSVDIVKTPLLNNKNYLSTLPYQPGNLTWKYNDSIPTNFYSQIISGAQMLPNGNVLICSGVQGRIFEVTEKGKTVWEYKVPIGPNEIQEDGDLANFHNVFRAEYYPVLYPAFKNRNLNPKGYLEKNPFPYTCYPESVKPAVVSLSPAKNTKLVLPTAPLEITFSEPILKNKGMLNIFSNGSPHENIPFNSNLISISGNKMTINHANDFPVNARIAVKVAANYIRDSSFNTLANLIDTASWHFFTVTSKPTVINKAPQHLEVNVKALTPVVLTFNENISKHSSGSIRLYENGQFLETLPVSSSRINVVGNVVTITPAKAFNSDKLIVVEVEACFKSIYNVLNTPIVYGDYYFRTAVGPKVKTLFPANASVNVLKGTDIKLTLDKNISLDSIKDIRVYENGSLKHTISTTDPNVTIDSNSLTLVLGTDFMYDSRIGISIPGYSLKDASGYFFNGIDTGSWHFNTEKIISVRNIGKDGFLKVYPSPNNGDMTIECTENITEVKLIDHLGRNINIDVTTSQDGKIKIKTENAASGIYNVLINGLYSVEVIIY